MATYSRSLRVRRVDPRDTARRVRVLGHSFLTDCNLGTLVAVAFGCAAFLRLLVAR